MTDRDKLARELAAIAPRATSAPWTGYSEPEVNLPYSLFAGRVGETGFHELYPMNGNDVDLIVALRNNLPTILAALQPEPAAQEPVAWSLTPVGEPCRLDECPPGLFIFNDTLGFRSEYWTSSIKPDAYCLGSGEYFWGGTDGNMARAALIVQPVELTRCARGGGQ